MLLIYIFGIEISSLNAQSNISISGARSMAMGDASSSLADEYSWENNPAGAAEVKQLAISSSFLTRYALANLNSVGIQAYLPFDKFTTGLAFKKFGDKYYNEQSIALGFANRMGIVSLGATVQLFQTSMIDLPSRFTYITSLGGIASIGKYLKWSAKLTNLNNAKINTSTPIYLPVILLSGLSYQASNELIICAELEKNLLFPAFLKFGLEYQIAKFLKLRTGVSTRPINMAVGFGLQHKFSKLDYAFTFHDRLGLCHQLSLIVQILRKKEQE